ncbi:MAG: hypothetical protein ABI577_18285 [bacterium]
MAVIGPKHSIVEGGCAGSGREFWLFGPVGLLLALLTRRQRKRDSLDAIGQERMDGEANDSR